ncbi:formylglycine-generating enzyme required for sulfatase activity [Actinoplanes campanulatus]|uniref:Formylglycine-generating enzyme required for sulfatase activity n=1 Tax=Actinoplanes campanulatus TaxID=113559 RepID=A0A7W5AIG5_9ACTN|nr:SUMF1/EgtB/PvdO family nonheme iron enzyme [Actinoplanes campanulatus]MBB3096666.1 formylglycine-generating enzyme required for sulfatase activity [Actinoplanes campanulatus]GGN30550.1 hypothetical protein GCM10010109_50240 [Actinoplanes campanulatus]GID37209.1 hypothetical protein Aca09nite_37150 [Actinoplanes campanulatus]
MSRCTPSSGRSASADRVPARATGDHGIDQIPVPGQTYAMGDAHGDGVRADGEQPVHDVRVPAFRIDATSVTVADFRSFIEATGFRTDAERYGWSAVFHLALTDPDHVAGRMHGTPWWLGVEGADWAHPGGPSDTAVDDHPVDDPREPATGSAKVIRGGSHLCHDSYCNRYRNAARSADTPDSSTGNTGFRTVAA